jgi:hypothetical protein
MKKQIYCDLELQKALSFLSGSLNVFSWLNAGSPETFSGLKSPLLGPLTGLLEIQ